MVERLHHATLKLHRDPLARGWRQPEGKTTRRQLHVWRPLRRRRNRELFLFALRGSIRTLTSKATVLRLAPSGTIELSRARVIAWAIIVHMHVRPTRKARASTRSTPRMASSSSVLAG